MPIFVSKMTIFVSNMTIFVSKMTLLASKMPIFASKVPIFASTMPLFALKIPFSPSDPNFQALYVAELFDKREIPLPETECDNTCEFGLMEKPSAKDVEAGQIAVTDRPVATVRQIPIKHETTPFGMNPRQDGHRDGGDRMQVSSSSSYSNKAAREAFFNNK